MFEPRASARAQMRVRVLRDAYDDAVAEREVASELLRDTRLPFPDGQQHYRDALVAERAALESYMNAVLDFKALADADSPPSPDR